MCKWCLVYVKIHVQHDKLGVVSNIATEKILYLFLYVEVNKTSSLHFEENKIKFDL